MGSAALYMSADMMTAITEYQQDIGMRPGTFCAYEVDVEGVADLRAMRAQAGRQDDPADPLGPWKLSWVGGTYPPSWEIATRLVAAGAAGILVPSAIRRGGINLVLWRWNDSPKRSVRPLDPQGDLP